MLIVILDLLYGIVLAVEIVLGVRFIITFAGIADMINISAFWNITNWLVSPFNGWLGKHYLMLGVYKIDLDVVVALVIYMIIALILLEVRSFLDVKKKSV